MPIIYRKRAMVFQAFQWNQEMQAEDYPEWARVAILKGIVHFINMGTPQASLKMRLASGKMVGAYDGDWVVRDPSKILYIVSKDKFESVYVQVPEVEVDT